MPQLINSCQPKLVHVIRADLHFILHDRGKNVRIDNLPVFVESHHGRHVLQRCRSRRGHLVVRHSRPGQRDI